MVIAASRPREEDIDAFASELRQRIRPAQRKTEHRLLTRKRAKRARSAPAILTLARVPQHASADIARQLVDLCVDENSPFSRAWLSYIPARLESVPALPHAAKAVASAIQYRRKPHLSSTRFALEQYTLAINKLRSELKPTEPVILTIMTLVYYEILVGGDIRAYHAHVRGLHAIFLQDNKWADNEVARVALSATWIGSMKRYIALGQPSPFEEPQWWDYEAPEYHCSDDRVLVKLAQQIFTFYPRLVSYLQEIRSCDLGYDSEVARDAVQLLEELLKVHDETAYRSVLSRCETLETTSEIDRSIIPYSFRFADVQDYDALLNYCRVRLDLVTLYYTLPVLMEDFPMPQSPHLRLEQLESLDNILMCWEACMHNQRFSKSMCSVLFPVYGAFTQMPTYHGKPIGQVLDWLEAKSMIAMGHWKCFSGLETLSAAWDTYCGGSPEKSPF